VSRLQQFMALESAGGIVLGGAALLALMLANSPLGPLYTRVLDIPLGVQVGILLIKKPLLLWVNDGLMAIFFMLVGLEVKREIAEGGLSDRAKAVLPVIAALGGMVVPALIYTAFNWGNAEALRGWAIPTATDIAFALGVLSLLGSRVPASLRLFLLAVAIIDDLGAIVIIAIFYTAELSWTALACAGVGVAMLAALNLAGWGAAPLHFGGCVPVGLHAEVGYPCNPGRRCRRHGGATAHTAGRLAVARSAA
jgi:Na+:H+ antiporter, NhaA family